MKDQGVDFPSCYGCGQENPIGFRLKYSFVDERSHIEFDIGPEHCGYPGLMHGGVTCVLFDEAMYHVIARTVPGVVTVTMAVDYKSPGFEGHRLICEAWVEKREGRRIEVYSTLIDAHTKKVVAEARAVYQKVDLSKIVGR
ncbi:MAG: PaaI family thioesterase [Methanomassiliicoccus sp.]|jgi:uncharacterized protein (TIGR00369 family)|nr:PaaI family thioesterase [Methanomassiliicoccus sp.]